MMDVMIELKKAGELYRSGDLKASLSVVQATWDELQGSKPEIPNAYLLVEYAVAILLKLNELDRALTWANLAPDFAEKRHDLGEAEFLLGKVYLARGDLIESKRCFITANAKSHGKIFDGERSEYIQLIK